MYDQRAPQLSCGVVATFKSADHALPLPRSCVLVKYGWANNGPDA